MSCSLRFFFRIDRPDLFYTGIMVISAFADTCVEVWRVTPVTNYDPASGRNVTTISYDYITGFSMYERYWFSMLTVDGDPTGLYVNSSRPVTVISGVSCGNVPLGTNFCDHMAEVVPSISELGTTHVVPPIYGRSPQAGYFVRVVPTKLNTTVAWSTAADGVIGTTVVDVGSFHQINTLDSSAPLLVVCSEPCVVMQYNKGEHMLVSLPTLGKCLLAKRL
jgi:hypothetical protein